MNTFLQFVLTKIFTVTISVFNVPGPFFFNTVKTNNITVEIFIVSKFFLILVPTGYLFTPPTHVINGSSSVSLDEDVEMMR